MRRVLVLAMALAASLPAGAETLRQILQRNAVPTTGFTPAELDGQFDSGAAMADSGRVPIAYPTRGADQTIGSSLQVVAYERSMQKLAHRAIAASETSDECFGSVLDIREQDHNILVGNRFSPARAKAPRWRARAPSPLAKNPCYSDRVITRGAKRSRGFGRGVAQPG